VYKPKAQYHLGFLDAAARTNDPVQKKHFTDAAAHFKNSAGLYNNMMAGSIARDYLTSGTGSDPADLLNEVYGTYRGGANEISTYLMQPNLTGALGQNRPSAALPQILRVGTDGAVIDTTVGAGGSVL